MTEQMRYRIEHSVEGPGSQYANRLSPRVGRFINAAGTTGFPTGKRAVSATQLM